MTAYVQSCTKFQRLLVVPFPGKERLCNDRVRVVHGTEAAGGDGIRFFFETAFFAVSCIVLGWALGTWTTTDTERALNPSRQHLAASLSSLEGGLLGYHPERLNGHRTRYAIE